MAEKLVQIGDFAAIEPHLRGRFIDRSRVLAALACMRKRWWGYEYKGVGLGLRKMRLPLATGAWTHVGLESLMKGYAVLRKEREQGKFVSESMLKLMIEDAVRAAVGGYNEELAERGLTIEDQFENPGSAFFYKEQTAMVEALVRVAALRIVPALAERYVWDPEDVELELPPIAMLPRHWWQSRLDAALTPKGELPVPGKMVLSWKTASRYGPWKDEENRIDMQGLSESWALEQATGEPSAGVQMCYLMKGYRSYNDFLGFKIQNTPLLRGWKNTEGARVEYAHSYGWTDPETGKSRRLGGKWKGFQVWEEFPDGVEEWISMIAGGEVQPEAGDVLNDQWVLPSPVWRGQAAIEKFVRQTTALERRISGLIEQAKANENWTPTEEWLDEHFPQNTMMCLKYGAENRCEWWELCHGAGRPEDPDLFVPRTANHKEEKAWLADLD